MRHIVVDYIELIKDLHILSCINSFHIPILSVEVLNIYVLIKLSMISIINKAGLILFETRPILDYVCESSPLLIINIKPCQIKVLSGKPLNFY